MKPKKPIFLMYHFVESYYEFFKLLILYLFYIFIF